MLQRFNLMIQKYWGLTPSLVRLEGICLRMLQKSEILTIGRILDWTLNSVTDLLSHKIPSKSKHFVSPLFNLPAHVLRLIMIYYRDKHSQWQLGTRVDTASSTAHMYTVSPKAKCELDENVVNITAATEEERGWLSAAPPHPPCVLTTSVFWWSSPFNFSSNSLSLLLRHEEPWCSDALVVLL